MKIHSGHGTPIWVSPRDNNNGVVAAQGRSHLQLDNEELQKFVEAVYQMTGIRATQTRAESPKATTPAKATMQRYRMA